MKLLTTLLAMLALVAAPLAHAAQFGGVVSHVTDGDTLWVRPDAGGEPVKIRIDGIDAPEICQHFGPEARDALTRLVLDRRVRVTSRARDIYHRTIARIELGNADVGATLVAHGLAWATTFHGRGRYVQLQTEARGARSGLWHAAAEEPRSFRRRHGSCHG